MKQNIAVWDCTCSYITMQVTAVKTLGNCEEELPKKPVGQLSVNCWTNVSRLSADSWLTVGRLPANKRPTDSQHPLAGIETLPQIQDDFQKPTLE